MSFDPNLVPGALHATKTEMSEASIHLWNSAGHVHAYERSKGGIIGGKIDRCAPSFVTIGDGGNRSGLASYIK